MGRLRWEEVKFYGCESGAGSCKAVEKVVKVFWVGKMRGEEVNGGKSSEDPAGALYKLAGLDDGSLEVEIFKHWELSFFEAETHAAIICCVPITVAEVQ